MVSSLRRQARLPSLNDSRRHGTNSVKFPPLTDGRIITRYKRFLADVQLPDGEIVTAHCPNTGSMKGCWTPGAPVQLSASDNPARKLRWTLERIDMGAGWVGVNTNRVNHIIADFIAAGHIRPLRGYEQIHREPRCPVSDFAKSRFDLLLRQAGRADCYVEIKNATLLEDNCIRFPDAVTARGRKHLEMLQHTVRRGYRGVLLFAVNRPEGECFRVAADIDPGYDETLRRVRENGVEVLAVRIRHLDAGVEAGGEVGVCLG